ncbi:MAG: hypothetical protein GF344_15630 [Chitinivibrionales bacterium]|nr:hypothetical protein [Chitinivibrionales bacterium]MBD3358131.1 hypothetical protein [Chitinivibrionales bacterium]
MAPKNRKKAVFFASSYFYFVALEIVFVEGDYMGAFSPKPRPLLSFPFRGVRYFCPIQDIGTVLFYACQVFRGEEK